MDRGAWRATVHGVTESDTTEATYHACTFRDQTPGLGILKEVCVQNPPCSMLVICGVCPPWKELVGWWASGARTPLGLS